MKYVYVLTSCETDYYYEQFLLSLASMRVYNPDAEVVVLIDEKTKQSLVDRRSAYEKLLPETRVINVPDSYSQKEASRWIKTSIHHYIPGEFLFIDCDTIVAQKLAPDFSKSVKIGTVLDCHVTLDNHHQREYFQKEDADAGFTSSLKTNVRYNGGLIYCRGDSDAHGFYEQWHSLWIEGLKKGCSQDMPSLNQAIYENKSIVTVLNGEWNCQISYNGLNFFHDAKIIHYFATSLSLIAHPYKLASAEVLFSIKETGLISAEISALLRNPFAAFEPNTRIVSGKYFLDVFDSPLFKLLIWLRDCHNAAFRRLNAIIRFLTAQLKKTSGYSKRALRKNS